MQKVAIVSPHRDDAAFSCGATLVALLRAGLPVTIVNIFTASDYAIDLSFSGADRAAAVTAMRLQEDEVFLQQAVASASSPASSLPALPPMLALHDLYWKDAPLRHALATELVLQSPLTARQVGLEVDELARDLAFLRSFDLVFAPLALGDHIDHRIARESARRVVDLDRLSLYEDLPYAARMDMQTRLQTAASILDAMRCDSFGRIPIRVAQAASLKLKLALCYPSQIAPDVAQEISNDAAVAGDAECVYANRTFLHRMARLLGNEATVLTEGTA